MPSYRGRLVAGGKKPYDTWTFAPVPSAIRQALGGGARIDVRGTIAGATFRATVSKGEGSHRFPVTREIRETAGVEVGDLVDIAIEVDTETRTIELPAELRDVLTWEALRSRFEELSPSLRRAWASHVASGKQPETRARRAREAPAGIRARRYPGQK
jgi:hypothetical protein